MYRPGYDSTEPGSTVSNPGWESILVTWVAFVLGPIVALFVIARPLLGVGLLVGLALAAHAASGRNVRRRPDARGGSTEPGPVAAAGGASRDAPGSAGGNP